MTLRRAEYDRTRKQAEHLQAVVVAALERLQKLASPIDVRTLGPRAGRRGVPGRRARGEGG